MYYTLNNNVYLVNGNSRGCIYDFNNAKLFSINAALKEKIELVNNGKLQVGDLDEETNKIFKQLLELDILKISETSCSHYITELKDSSILTPDFAWIEITTKCNLRCKHCYNESDIYCDNIMSLDEFKLVIDKIKKIGIDKVQLIGGEPFFNKEILNSMIEYIKDKFSFIEIFTNGTLGNEAWVQYLKKNKINVALSIYSYDKECHDKITGVHGSWEKTNAFIKLLKEYDVPYRVCNVLMKGLELGEKNTSLYCLSEDRDVVRMSGRGNLSLLSDELIKKRLITKKSFQKPIKKSFCVGALNAHNCFKNKIYISTDLQVYPCVMERRIKHCSISKNEDILLDKEILTLTKDTIKECSICEYRYACFDCRPNTLEGILNEKPWYCTYDPYLGKWEDPDKFISTLRAKYI